MNIKKFLAGVSAGVLMLGALAVPAFAAPACTPTGFFRDGINLTAAQIGGDVAGPLDATGCDIGVYYSPSSINSVSDADIFGARYYGVVNQGGAVDVTSSKIHDIGNNPFDGSQHGVGVYYASVDNGSAGSQPSCDSTRTTTGTIDGNTISAYQKGGVVINCAGADVTVTNNTVTGLGRVDFIAQNGIQVSRGAGGVVRGNNVSDNFYTGTVGVGPNPGGQNPPGWEYTSGGILLYQAGDVKVAQNKFSGNQRNMEMVP